MSLGRWVKVGAWVVAAPLLLVTALLIAANTGAGQRELARLVTQASGGSVAVTGLSGRFPDRLKIAAIAISDPNGTWLTLADLTLDWHPLDLLDRTAAIDRLSAGDIHLLRLPASQGGSSGTGGFSLPLRVRLQNLAIGRLVLDAPVAGTPASLAISGDGALTSLQQGRVTLDATRLDGGGTYHLTAAIDPAHITAELHAAEPAGGLASSLAGLPDLGAITADATLAGPRDGLDLRLSLGAGPLRAAAAGRLDLAAMAADLHVTARAPAMTPRPDIAWASVALDAQVKGPFTRPDASGTLRIADLAAAGASARTIELDISGNQGAAALQGSLTGLRIPGPQPDLLAADPVRLAAAARLDDPARPVTLQVSHPLMQLAATGHLSPSPAADATLHVPDLARFAALGGVDLQGSADLTAHAERTGQRLAASAAGTVAIAGGLAPLPALLGTARLALSAVIEGDDITIRQAAVTGRTLTASVTGTDRAGVLALDWQAGLSDLAALAPTLAGELAASGGLTGPTDDLAATADVRGQVTAQGVASGPLRLAVRATGLPATPQASLTAGGALAGAPLTLQAALSRAADGAMNAQIDRLDWQSAHADGAVALAPGATLPTGRLNLAMTRLAQLRPLLGLDVTGAIEAHLALPAVAGPARLSLTGRDLGVPGTRVARLDLAGTVADPLARPVIDLTATAAGIAAGGATATLRLQAAGPPGGLAVRLAAEGRDTAGRPVQASAAASIDATTRQVLLASLAADWHGLQPRLLAPARIALADGVAVDRLRLGLGAATLELAGRLTPRLDATIALRNVTPALAQPFDPGLQADGMLQADARLTGAPAQPEGQVRLAATGLRLRAGPARALPPAAVTITANLAGGTARLDASVTAGRNHVGLTGQAPLAATGPLALKLAGLVDLSVLDPILTAGGRRVRGKVSLDAAIGGTPQAPRIDGSLRLADGEVQDFTQGLHVEAISANLLAAGDTLRIEHVTGRAGGGTVSVAGSIGVLNPALPLDLTIAARHATLLASDQMTATIDADLTLKGEAMRALAAAGRLIIDRADIRVPETLPASVVSLHVLRAGQAPAPPPAPGIPVSLAIDIAAPNPVFVRGRGLDAELEGAMKIGGTVANPVPSGGLTMRRGTFSVAGTTLSFSKGEVQFGGGGLSNPDLDFVATSANATVTANLEISGSVSHPVITLSSTPDLPQDEVLAQLLFGTSESQLSPFQIAGIAQTLAQFSGVGGGLTDPLESLRQGLGLDRLSVGGGASGTALQAGRYVATGVYVGAKQAVGASKSTNGEADPTTQATVQIDITKRLKIEGDVGAGQGANAVGLTYQFEY